MINFLKHKDFEKFLALPLLLIVTTIVFLPSLSNGFFSWDDKKVALSGLVQTLDTKQLAAFFTTFHAGLYHPLTTISFAIDYQIGHGSPFPFHLTNLLLHLTNCCLVYFLIKKVTSIQYIPFFVALLFGIHPMHVEAVAWITSRKDLLYCFFLLSSLLFYVSYLKHDRILYYLLALLFFLFSSLSKIQAIVLPFILLLVDYLFRRKLFNLKVIAEKIPFLIIMAFLVLINLKAQHSYGYMIVNSGYSILERLILFGYGMYLYIAKLFVPYPISIFYPFPFVPSAYISMTYLFYPLFILLVSIGLVFLIIKSYREEVFGLLFFFICISLALIVTNYREYIIADKYSYLASIGMFYFLFVIFHKLIHKYNVNQYVTISLFLFLVISSSFLTWNQNKLWNTPLKLFSKALEQYPKTPILLTTLGSVATDSGMYTKAIEYLDLAISIDKDNVYSYYNRGIAENKLKKVEMALNDFTKAIYLNPDFLDPYFARANIYSNIGDFQKAMEDYTYILNKDLSYSGAWQNRAIVKGNIGDFKGAIEDLNRAILLSPNSGSAYYLRGIAKFEVNINGCDDLEQALSLNYQDANKAIQHYCQ